MLLDEEKRTNGARGRSRTADTAIFSRMLYQLSYPGTGGGIAPAVEERRAYKRQSSSVSTPYSSLFLSPFGTDAPGTR